MEYLKSLQSKIYLLELKLQYVVKKLPFYLKTIFLLLSIVFLISLLFIISHLDKKFSLEVPTNGGTLNEGIVGTPRFVNPVLTISDADRDLTMLIYSGLLRMGPANELIPDLAEKYEVSENGLCYTFILKPDLLWSDGTKLTTDDVIFTIDLIKNPGTKSTRRASWEGIETTKIDERTIRFCLPNPYAPFLENTTIGLLPKHIWEGLLPEQLPLSNFNIQAIGSGPYKIETVSRDTTGIITSYSLKINKNFALQKPFIENIVLKFYPSEKKLIEAYQQKVVDSLSALSPQRTLEIKRADSFLKTYLLPRVFAVFFNQNDSPIFAEKEVRTALNLIINKQDIVNKVLQNFGLPINNPIPPGSLGFIEEKSAPTATSEEQINQAKQLLEKNGWKWNEKENIWEKKKNKQTLKLEFSLTTSNMPELVQTAQLLKEAWQTIGMKTDVKIYEIGDLEQNVIRPRKYSALLFGEVMGRDPDAFAFWHSSQRNDPGLNVALYTNISVDKILEEARAIFDSKKRAEKYQEFQKELKKDLPAIFLYSPSFIYLLPQSMSGLQEKSITIPSERFSQVYNWYLETKKVWRIFVEN